MTFGFLEGAAVTIIVSAAVRALPKPPKPCSKWQHYVYCWFYNFAHGILANWDRLHGAEDGKWRKSLDRFVS